MYNRYIPQSDGSYQRNPVSDATGRAAATKQAAPREVRPPEQPPCKPSHTPEPVGGFLRQLLPKHFDTADMIIVLLLLLLSCDSEEDKNTAMLTLALYLFM